MNRSPARSGADAAGGDAGWADAGRGDGVVAGELACEGGGTVRDVGEAGACDDACSAATPQPDSANAPRRAPVAAHRSTRRIEPPEPSSGVDRSAPTVLDVLIR
jgi:hypothetical protein